MGRPNAARDAVAALDSLGAVWSPDFDAYASGQLDASASAASCAGTRRATARRSGPPEYLALVDRLHGRTGGVVRDGLQGTAL